MNLYEYLPNLDVKALQTDDLVFDTRVLSGKPINLEIEILFVARIDRPGTFKVYWCHMHEAYLGSMYEKMTMENRTVYYVAANGRKMADLTAAESVFPLLAECGMRAIY